MQHSRAKPRPLYYNNIPPINIIKWPWFFSSMLPGPEHGQVGHLFVPDHTIVIDVQIVLDIYVSVCNNGHFGSFGTPVEGLVVCLIGTYH